MIEYRPILFIMGFLLSVLAIIMLIPAVFDLLDPQHNDWISFFLSAFLTAFVGISLILTNRMEWLHLTIKQAFILTVTGWIAVVAFAALPFLFSDLHLKYTDAFFETMSGITTTGTSVLIGIDFMPPGMLLWRSLLTGIGGIGTIIFTIAVLPMLRIGGMQLFKTESADNAEKTIPRMTQISLVIASIYLLFVSLCSAALWCAGMDSFDAINHSLAIIATTGFSTHDAGLAFYNSVYIDYIATFFMAISGVSFILYVQFLRGDKQAFLRDEQVKLYIRILLASILIVAIWLHFAKHIEWHHALRYGAIGVTSAMTTTGFNSVDSTHFGSSIDAFLLMLAVIGGCAGGTSGGIKIFRLQILYSTVKAQFAQLIQPHAVVRMRYNGKTIPDGVAAAVMSFIILYGISVITVAMLLSLTGLDFFTGINIAVACMSNIGYAFGTVFDSSGNYSSVPDAGKWIMAFAMLLGRLEIFTVLILFSRKFWKG